MYKDQSTDWKKSWKYKCKKGFVRLSIKIKDISGDWSVE